MPEFYQLHSWWLTAINHQQTLPTGKKRGAAIIKWFNVRDLSRGCPLPPLLRCQVVKRGPGPKPIKSPFWGMHKGGLTLTRSSWNGTNWWHILGGLEKHDVLPLTGRSKPCRHGRLCSWSHGVMVQLPMPDARECSLGSFSSLWQEWWLGGWQSGVLSGW